MNPPHEGWLRNWSIVGVDQPELSRNGVRFGIYKNGEYHDRLFPYDPIPRIIESDEFDRMEAGLKQRVNALNAYLRDIYSDKQAIKDGIVPEEYVYTSAGYFRKSTA